MRKPAVIVGLLFFSMLLLLCIYINANSVNANQAPVLSTDKTHYNPGETVNIYGTYFSSSSAININVYLPNGNLDSTWTVNADNSGSFSTSYYLVGAEGIFKITATDTNGNTATATFDDALSVTYDFYGWDMISQSWTKGNLAGWKEGDLVNYKLVIGTSGSDTSIALGASLKIGYSFYDTGAQGKNGTLVDYIQNFRWGTTDFTTQTPSGYTAFTPIGLTTPVTTPDTCDNPSPDRYFDLAPGSASTGIPGSLNTGGTLVVYYEAHLSRTIVWQNALEKYFPQITSQISWASTATCAHGGASFFPGASGHFYINEPNLGNKEIPIPVPPMPSGSISGHKYNDVNVNSVFNSGVDQPISGWPVNLSGTVDGVPISFSTTTDANGLYSFMVLTDGTWTVNEGNLTGWVSSPGTLTSIPVTIPLPTGSPYGAAGSRVATNVDFFNYQPGQIVVDKVTNPSGSTQSFDFNASGPNSYSALFSLTDAATPWNSGPLIPGSYAVAEVVPAGWDLTGVTVNGTASTNGASITVGSGQTIVVNFTDTQRAKIITDKITSPSGSLQSFNFTTTGTGYSAFSLTDSTTPNDSGWLLPGTYTVAEAVPTGWTLTGVTKNGTAFTNGGDIVLAAGDIVHIDFTDVQQAKIIVDKITNPSGSTQSFNFTTTGTGYNGFSLTDSADPNDSGYLAPGTYTVTETVPNGWTLTSVTKNGASFTNGGDIVLNAGDVVYVNFTDTQLAKIIVDKITNPSSSLQSFDFSTTGTGYNGFSLTDAATPNDSDYLEPGTYTVTEDVPAGWTLTSVLKNGVAFTNGGSIVLNAGDVVYVNFTDTQQAKIIVDKITNPIGSSQSFAFAATGTGYSSFSLTDTDTPNDSGYLAPGTYTVTETVPVGWTLSSVTKNGAAFTNGGDIVLNAGDVVYVNFTNTQLGKIIVDKITNPSGSVQSFNFSTTGTGYGSFSLTDSADPNDSGYLAPGTYTVTEAVPAGWTLTSVTKNGAVFTNGGNIVLGAGETIYVNFTNTQQARIIVDKSTDPAASPESFSFSASGPNGYSATFSLTDTSTPWNSGYLSPGTGYAITETVPAGWELTGVTVNGTSSSNGASLTLNPGDILLVNFTDRQLARFVKEFTGSGALPGYTAPVISPDHLSSYVSTTKTGPAIWWTITYTVTNRDTVGHNYIVWDKWGGNLMVLNSTPTGFTSSGKGAGTLTLANGNSFSIKYSGYSGYIGSGLVFTSTKSEGLGTSQGIAYVTLHTGDQQQGTNPGGGKGSSKDGSAYDLDVRWEIGWLDAGQTATFTIIVAPGINPGGQLEFTSIGTSIINTGPVVRVYSDTTYSNSAFLYAVPDTNQLTVYVVSPKPSWA